MLKDLGKTADVQSAEAEFKRACPDLSTAVEHHIGSSEGMTTDKSVLVKYLNDKLECIATRWAKVAQNINDAKVPLVPGDGLPQQFLHWLS